MTESRKDCCANCRFYCQEIDLENRLYFDGNSGECRRMPPHSNFVWHKTRPEHWCGEWQAVSLHTQSWQRISTHARDDRPVLLYKKGAFCKHGGIVVGYWNARFNRWHDDGDGLYEPDDFTHWMALPEAPDV